MIYLLAHIDSLPFGRPLRHIYSAGGNFPLPHNCFCFCLIFCFITTLFREKGLFREVIHFSGFSAYPVYQLPCPFPFVAASPEFTHSSEKIDSAPRFIFGFQLSGSSQLPGAGVIPSAPQRHVSPPPHFPPAATPDLIPSSSFPACSSVQRLASF